MNVQSRALAAAVLGATIAIFAVVAPGPPASALASACTANAGVTVIVDFSHFGRAIERGCAPGHPTTALAALRAAGFETAGTTQYGNGFVCRIDGLPTPKSEACAVTPPARASWSFYFAHPTDTAWTYSSAGVSSYQPQPGSIVAFAFGDYAQPGIRPSAVIAPPPTTAPTMPTTGPTSPTVTAEAIAPSTAAPTTAEPPSTTSNRSTVPSPATTQPPPTSVPSSTSAPPRVIDRTAAGAVAKTSSGSPLPAVLTVALVALLGAGAGRTIRARRRRAA